MEDVGIVMDDLEDNAEENARERYYRSHKRESTKIPFLLSLMFYSAKWPMKFKGPKLCISKKRLQNSSKPK